MTQQPGLFSGPPEPGAPPLAAAARTGKRGRGAIPRVVKPVVLEGKNPAGRSKLTFDFRPLSGWEDRRLDAALEVIVEYFKRIGGLRVATDRIVRTVYNALEHHTREELIWAVAQKARSLYSPDLAERRSKREKYLADIESFFAERLDAWIERSPEYQRALEQRLKVEAEVARQVQQDQRDRNLSPEQIRERTRAWLRERGDSETLLTEKFHREWQAFLALEPARRDQCKAEMSGAIKAVAADRRLDPHDPQMDPYCRRLWISRAKQLWPAAFAAGFKPTPGEQPPA